MKFVFLCSQEGVVEGLFWSYPLARVQRKAFEQQISQL